MGSLLSTAKDKKEPSDAESTANGNDKQLSDAESTTRGNDKEPSGAESTSLSNETQLSEIIAEAFEVCQQITEEVVRKAIATIAAIEVIPIKLPECSICYEEMNITDVATLPCGHQYHKQCVGSWMLEVRKTTCPLCRLKVPPKVRSVLRRYAPKPPPKKRARK